MHWTEEAIILSARKFGENSLLVEVISESKGMYSGLVRGGQSKKKIADWQSGNIIEATWRGRLEEQLGTFTGELINPIAAKVINESAKLQAVLSLNSLLRKTLPDRHPYPEIYSHYKEYLTRLCHSREGGNLKIPAQARNDSSIDWAEDYAWMEIAILKYLGYGLDLTTCAVTGTHENLKYISPRTGRAVSLEGAAGYEEKLFKIPDFIINEVPATHAQIIEILEITAYFLEKSLFHPHNRQLPEERGRFIKILQKHLQTRANTGNLHEIA